MKTANIIQKKIPNAKFLVVGSAIGDFSQKNQSQQPRTLIKNFLNKHPNLEKKTILTGFINKIEEVYNATDILVSSSLLESFGLTLAEAAACQIPIVSTNVGNQHLIVQENKTGFLVPPNHPKLLAKKIIKLAQNPKLRQQFGKNARQHIIAEFSLENYINKVTSIYLSLLK